MSESPTSEEFPLRGLMPRKQFAKAIRRSERTVKRLEDAGKVVTVPLAIIA